MKNKVLFLDRDGNINVDQMSDYVIDAKDFVLIPGIAKSMARAKIAGFRLVLITNQACIGKGLLTEAGLNAIHSRMEELIRKEAGNGFKPGEKVFDAMYFCPHLPSDRCECRKPATKMLREGIALTNADLSRSYIVGDKLTDIDCGARENIKGILVRTGHGLEEEPKLRMGKSPVKAHAVVDSLVEAIDLAIRETA